MRKAGAVIHSHGLESCLATMINPGAKEFRVSVVAVLVFLWPLLALFITSNDIIDILHHRTISYLSF